MNRVRSNDRGRRLQDVYLRVQNTLSIYFCSIKGTRLNMKFQECWHLYYLIPFLVLGDGILSNAT